MLLQSSTALLIKVQLCVRYGFLRCRLRALWAVAIETDIDRAAVHSHACSAGCCWRLPFVCVSLASLTQLGVGLLTAVMCHSDALACRSLAS